MNTPRETLTALKALLLAAARLPAEFSEWDLTFRAWLVSPAHFGMRGYRDRHPDHKAAYAALVHRGGPLRLGLIERVGPSRYRLTGAGKAAAARVPAALREGAGAA